MISGWLISILTFPGVVIHEFAHKKFCDWFNVRVLAVRYFTADAGGHVIHERTNSYKATFWISVGPLIINSSFCFLFAIIAGFFYESSDSLLFLFGWLAMSSGAHSFPSNQDVDNVLEESKRELKDGGHFLHYLSYPFVGLIYIANALRFFWIDFIWAFGIIMFAFSMVGVSDWSNSTSSNNFNPNSYYEDSGDGLYNIGEYLCSLTHYVKAGEIEPSNEDKMAVDKLTSDIERRVDYLEMLEVDITNIYVDEYSQYSVDSYNSKVDNYNRLRENYNSDYSAYERRLKLYNFRVDRYNNYLADNCRRAN